MWSRLFHRSKQRHPRAAAAPDHRARRLVIEQFEARTMMAGIPALSSLPNAEQTIYLDFDGDFQSVWNRTDSGQTYRNVNAGEFNIDNRAGISAAEEAAIRKIWETVADDYAPFNVNVTTVEPPSFANGAAIRVVMAGDISAIWQKDANTQVTINDDVFIVDSSGNKVDTSGYAALDSYTNDEPNVVYVFAKYMSTWGMVDSEGHSRDLRAIIATTASHEAGHAFGLEHHGNYDVGSGITTPIMGGNVQGDRTIWSRYQVGNETHDNLAQLTGLFGARGDDFSGSYQSAPNFAFTSYSPLLGWRGSVQGIIGTGGDSDMFRLTVGSAATYNLNVTVPQFGNLDSRLVLYRVHQIPLFGYYYETIATVDPGISSITPFQGLGASLSKYLQPGNYAIAVKSHGGYGDLGNYTLSIGHSAIAIVFDPVLTTLSRDGGAGTTTSDTDRTTNYTTTAKLSLVGGGAGQSASQSTSQSTEQSAVELTQAGRRSLGQENADSLSADVVDAILTDWSLQQPAVRRGQKI